MYWGECNTFFTHVIGQRIKANRQVCHLQCWIVVNPTTAATCTSVM